MERAIKKIVMGLIISGIIFVSIFTFVVQTQIESISTFKNEPFVVKIFSDKDSGYPPFDVNFSSIAINYEGNVKYFWDFGDGETSNKENPMHTYQTNSSFIVSLNAIDNEGRKSSDSIKIQSKINRPPGVTILINNARPKREYKVGLPLISEKNGLLLQKIRAILPESLKNSKGPISCSAQVDDPEGDDILSYRWILKPPTILTITGIDVTPTYEYEGKDVTFSLLDTYVNGEYNLELNVTDSAGKSRSTSLNFRIQVSQTESKRGFLYSLIFTTFLSKIYDQLFTEKQKHAISDPLWLLFGPIDSFVRRFAGYFPDNIEKIIIGLWGFIYDMFSTKFPSPVPNAKLICSLNNSEFNFTANVFANGSVPIDTNISRTISIKNIDVENKAKQVYVKLKVNNRKFSGRGLDPSLEKPEFEISMTSGGINTQLFYNSIYKEGFEIKVLSPGDKFTGEIVIRLHKSEEGTFIDNQIYDCRLFIYQEAANYLLHFYAPDIINFQVVT